MTKPSIANPVSRFRGPIARGIESSEKPAVERKGGDKGAGIIRGVSAITVGEALGHDLWADQQTVEETVAAIQASGSTGVKVRFGHPSASGDSVGKFVGRMKNARVLGEKAVADLHFDRSARRTPEHGDLAEYLMDLAESDPKAFGASIVFQHDKGAVERFEAQHKNSRGEFQSPDPRNKNHYPHVRIAKLGAVDVVDSPAANPEGLFHATAIPAEADALMAFILGEDDEAPELGELGVDPERARSYVSRFLAQRGLTVSKKNESAATTTLAQDEAAKTTSASAEAATETSQEATKPAETSASAAASAEQKAETFTKADLAELFSIVGPEMGAKAITEGLSLKDACKARIEQLQGDLTKATTELAALKAAGATLGSEAVSGGTDQAAAKGPDAERQAKFKAQLGDRLGEAAAAVRLPGASKAASN